MAQANGLILRLLSYAVAVMVLTACSHTPPKPPPNRGRFAPLVNPHPRYVMTIKGHIDPALQKQLKLTLITHYYTTNNDCEYTVNAFEGVASYREVNHAIVVQPGADGNFSYAVPLDLYFPGFCGWELRNINYAFGKKMVNYSIYELGSFVGDEAKIKNSTGKDDWYCNKALRCRTKSKFLGGNDNLSSHSNHNYILKFTEKI